MEGKELFLLFESGVGSGVAEGRECFFPTPEKMRGGRFVHCVIGVCLLIVFVAIGKRVRRMEATAMTRDSHLRGRVGVQCVLFLVCIYVGESVKLFGVWFGHCCCLVCLISRARVEDIDRVYTLWFG